MDLINLFVILIEKAVNYFFADGLLSTCVTLHFSHSY